MKFHFSFQKVLDVKEKEKEQAQQEFGSVKHRQMELEDRIRALHELKRNYLDQYNHVNQKTILQIMQIQEQVDYIDRHLQDLAKQSFAVNDELDLKQRELMDKAKEEKMWQQWKSRSFEAFQKQMAQKEQAMLDEMAVLRHSRHM